MRHTVINCDNEECSEVREVQGADNRTPEGWIGCASSEKMRGEYAHYDVCSIKCMCKVLEKHMPLHRIQFQ